MNTGGHVLVWCQGVVWEPESPFQYEPSEVGCRLKTFVVFIGVLGNPGLLPACLLS